MLQEIKKKGINQEKIYYLHCLQKSKNENYREYIEGGN